MKKYFKYQLKKNLLPLAVLTAFAMILYVLPLAIGNYNYWNYQGYGHVNIYSGFILAALGIMCAFAPVAMFSYKMKKRSVDMYYSLPLSKTKIFAVHFIVGFLVVLAAYSAAYWLGFVIVVAKIRKLYYIYYLWMYLASLIPAFIIYTLSAFSFTRANTLVDGVIFIILTHCALFIVAGGLQSVLGRVDYNYNEYINPGSFIASGPLISVGEAFGDLIREGAHTGYSGWGFSVSWGSSDIEIYNIVNDIVAFGLTTLAAGGATAAMFLTERNCKAENCAQISESIFGYKSMIPIYYLSLTLILTESSIQNNLVAWCVLAFCAFLAIVVYRRTIKIGFKHTLYFAVCLAAGIFSGILVSFI